MDYNSSYWPLVLVSVLGLSLLFGIIFFLWYRRQLLGVHFEDPRLEGLRHFAFPTLRKATDNFSDTSKLGKGGFGEVFAGRLPDTDPVLPGLRIAIKRQILKGSKDKIEEATKTFLNEVEILSQAHHVNLVKFRGCCFRRNQLYLVLDYVAPGSLRRLLDEGALLIERQQLGLQESPVPALDWFKRLRIALGSAQGISYLHNQVEPRILHLNINSENILVDQHFNAKVADFGLSKMRDQEGMDMSANMKHWKGTIGYMDPSFNEDGTLTRKSDVYSFGVVLLELATDWAVVNKETGTHLIHRVVKAIDETEDFLSLAPEAVKRQISEGIGESNLFRTSHGEEVRSESSRGQMFKRFVCVGLWCCSRERRLRPDMEDVVRALSSIVAGHEEMGSEGCVLGPNAPLLAEAITSVGTLKSHETPQVLQDSSSVTVEGLDSIQTITVPASLEVP